MIKKQCKQCGKSEPEVKFWKHSIAKDGLQWKCSKCLQIGIRDWYKKNIKKRRAKGVEYRLKWRQEMINAYGGKCDCCGETEPKFLTIDHINGGGKKDREQNGNTILKLKRLGWPQDGYRLLCFNCNCSRGFYGECPHKNKI